MTYQCAALLYQELTSQLKEERKDLRMRRIHLSQRSQTGAQAVNIGFILERICPLLKAFRFDKNDCRSLFDPIDYLIFEGLSDSGKVSRIIFSEIKTGAARLSPKQRQIKNVVENGKVEFDIYSPEK